MLPKTKPSADVREAREFGAPRAKGERVHAGIDLAAELGDPVVAPEGGSIVAIQGPTWSGNTPSAAVLLATDTGIVLNLGELDPDALAVAVGDRVEKRQLVGYVGPTSMLHFEAYRSGTKSTKQWLSGQPAPVELLDPTAYVQAAAADVGAEVADLPTWDAIKEAIASKGAAWWPAAPSLPSWWPSSSTPPDNRTAPSSSTPPDNRTAPSSGGGAGLVILAAALVWGLK